MWSDKRRDGRDGMGRGKLVPRIGYDMSVLGYMHLYVQAHLHIHLNTGLFSFRRRFHNMIFFLLTLCSSVRFFLKQPNSTLRCDGFSPSMTEGMDRVISADENWISSVLMKSA